MSQNFSPPFKEKKWGKDIEGEHVIDGYVFRGKLRFKKAVEGLKGAMVKGAFGEYNGVKYNVKDARKKGTGIEAEIEVDTKKISERGFAVMEMMGPNNRKEHVVMITKSKASEAKFVIILSEEIVKPMMVDFMNDKDISAMDKEEKIDRKVSLIKCSQCDKTCKTNTGLKRHVTTMHRADETDDKRKQMPINTKNTETNSKTYEKKCEKCDFKTEANKRYVAAQHMIKHKEIIHNSLPKFTKITKCSKCDFSARDSMIMRRHMRDVHEAGSVSTSPPPKKKRKSPDEDEKVETMEMNDERIEDLSFEFEDMEIDEVKDEFKHRSELMDQKIKLRQNKIERQETITRVNKVEIEKMKLEDEENKIKSQKEQNKKRKQTSKDERKRKNIKSRKINKKNEDENVNKNLKDIPEEVEHLVNKDDLVYVVRGDGTGCPRKSFS